MVWAERNSGDTFSLQELVFYFLSQLKILALLLLVLSVRSFLLKLMEKLNRREKHALACFHLSETEMTILILGLIQIQGTRLEQVKAVGPSRLVKFPVKVFQIELKEHRHLRV